MIAHRALSHLFFLPSSPLRDRQATTRPGVSSLSLALRSLQPMLYQSVNIYYFVGLQTMYRTGSFLTWWVESSNTAVSSSLSPLLPQQSLLLLWTHKYQISYFLFLKALAKTSLPLQTLVYPTRRHSIPCHWRQSSLVFFLPPSRLAVP